MITYANWLHEVGKLVYIIGNLNETALIKKTLDPADPKYLHLHPEIVSTFAVWRNFPRMHWQKSSSQGYVRVSCVRTGFTKYYSEYNPYHIVPRDGDIRV
jgi:hypothetical protein